VEQPRQAGAPEANVNEPSRYPEADEPQATPPRLRGLPQATFREKCPKCGAKWFGQAKCDCGWRPNAAGVWIKAGVVLLLGVATIAWIWTVGHLREYFPDDKSADAYFAKAKDFFKDGSIKEAIVEYEHAVTESPKRSDIRYRYAQALAKDGGLNEAVNEMETAAALDPGNKTIAGACAKLYEQCGEDANAAKIYEKLAVETNDASYNYRLGIVYERLGQNDRAENFYKISSGKYPKMDGVWISLSRIQAKQGKTKEATATLRAGMQLIPSSANLHQSLGYLLSDAKQKDSAASEFRKCAELNPAYAEQTTGILDALAASKSVKEYYVPLSYQGQSYFVEAVLNERARVKLLVDSGADSCLISAGTAHSLKLDMEQAEPIIVQGVNGAGWAQRLSLKSVRVGIAKEKGISCIVKDQIDGCDGLLGMSFLSRFRFSVDSQRKLLVLTKR